MTIGPLEVAICAPAQNAL